LSVVIYQQYYLPRVISFTYAFFIIVVVMPVPRSSRKRPATALAIASGRPNAVKRKKGSESQPIPIDASQPSKPIVIDVDTQRESPPTSPRRAILVASQGAEFDTQLRNPMPEDAIVAPVEASEVATASSEAADENVQMSEFDSRMVENYNGIDWGRLPWFIKPVRTPKTRKSWIYGHDYRLRFRGNTNRIYWLCHICHQRKAVGVGFAETTEAQPFETRS
jgi:hypothetical protein